VRPGELESQGTRADQQQNVGIHVILRMTKAPGGRQVLALDAEPMTYGETGNLDGRADLYPKRF
jgi:hypothetical protein